jgi:putative flippase GtrA
VLYNNGSALRRACSIFWQSGANWQQEEIRNMKNTIKTLMKICAQNKELVLYLFFGVCTTAINTICYWLLYDVLLLSNVTGTVLAWLTAVIFAFITNKRFVFGSKRTNTQERINEIVSFFGCRLLTGILDVAIMAVAVDMLRWNGLLWKLISNIIVTIINYIASKFWIFKKPNDVR